MDASTLYYLSKFAANNYTNILNGANSNPNHDLVGGGGIVDNSSIIAMDAYLRSLYSITSTQNIITSSSSISTCSTSSSVSSASSSPSLNKNKNLKKDANSSKSGFSIADILGTANKNLQKNVIITKPKQQLPLKQTISCDDDDDEDLSSDSSNLEDYGMSDYFVFYSKTGKLN
jgi:hypothetical protein